MQNNGFEQGLQALLTEAERVRQHGFTQPELDRTKKEMMRGMEQAYRERDKQPSRSFAGGCVRHILEGEAIPGIEKCALYMQYVPTIELDEINALASAWNSGRNRVITVDAPDRAGVKVPTQEELLAVLRRLRPVKLHPIAKIFRMRRWSKTCLRPVRSPRATPFPNWAWRCGR